jgi:hypothetical protein
MGLIVVSSFDYSVINENILGYSFSVTVCAEMCVLTYNHGAVDGASVTLVTPANGSIPITWASDTTVNSIAYSQYNGSVTYFSYIPNDVYSLNVVTPYGTANASLNAPGDITFSADGSSVTALYAGNSDSASVLLISGMSPVTTYISPSGVNVGSPFSYPPAAYNAPSYPATFEATYAAGLTVTTFSGTAGAQGGFTGNESLTNAFTR